MVLGQLLAVSLVVRTANLAVDLAPLVVVAAVAVAVESYFWPRWQSSAVEALLAAGFVGSADTPEALLAYLTVPGFSAALRCGRRAGLAVVGVASLALIGFWTLLGPEPVPVVLASATVWMALAAGLAAAGAWGHDRMSSLGDEDRAYESASRLLDDFAALRPRLTRGLDLATLAEEMLERISGVVGPTASAVLVEKDEHQAPRVLASRFATDEWLRQLEPGNGQSEDRPANQEKAWTFPLTQGRTGRVVIDLEEPLQPDVRTSLDALVSEDALRLRTAEAFADVWRAATQQERLRLSRDIHDGIAQDLAAIAYAADDAVSEAVSPNDRERLAALRDALRLLLSELRVSIFDLRADDRGQPLAAAVSDLARRTAEAADLELQIHMSGSGRLDGSLERELTLIAQEALANVRRHANATTLWVEVDQSPEYASIRISDNGRGLGWRPAPMLSSGISGMRGRAESIGADLVVANRSDGGTVVHVTYGGSGAGHARVAHRSTRRRPRAH